MEFRTGLSWFSDEFVVGQDDLSNLVIRQASEASPLRYFYDESKSRLVKTFVLGSTARTKTLCQVTLVDGSEGKLSPRLEFSVRDTTAKAIESIDEPVVVGETRTIKARVDLKDYHANFWTLITFLRAFPEIELPDGDHKVVEKADADLLARMTPFLIDALREGTLPSSTSVDLLEAMLTQPDAVAAIANAGAGGSLRTIVQRAELTQVVEELQTLVDDPSTTEPQLQKLLEEHWWIFGGRFIDQVHRRLLTVHDQLDIPLVQTDGSLHVIELKRAAIPKLVIPYRNHYVVGPDVNTAVGQATNYLRSLDEHRPSILADLELDVRRARVTVVIGDLQHCADVDAKTVQETIRTYNSHLTRVEVLTYDDLMKGARRTLALTAGDAGLQPE